MHVIIRVCFCLETPSLHTHHTVLSHLEEAHLEAVVHEARAVPLVHKTAGDHAALVVDGAALFSVMVVGSGQPSAATTLS